MRTLFSVLAAATMVAGCSTFGYNDRYNDDYYGYDYNRPDPRYGGYYADRYYRDDPRRDEWRMSSNDRVYRGRDGRYYCRRSDGTTGLLVGGAVGGVLGNIIAPGGSELLGTIIGAGAGATLGAAIERGEVRCR